METLKIINQIGMQGDCEFFLIEKIPSDAIKIEKQFIAESERSGSLHGLFGNYDQYEVDGGFCLDVKEDCILNHTLKENLNGISMEEVKVLPKKDHRHSIIRKGLYYVGIQQKFDPLEGIKKRVID
jgi:hypothetical protein